MIDETIADLKSSIAKAHEALKRELAKLRTGRAHPSLLDSIRVDAYGSPTPIAQLATVSVPEARMLTIKPWDKSQIKAIEKALVQSPLGLTPMNDGDIIRLPMQPLSEERRKEMVKLAKRAAEDSKVVVRKARHDAKELIETLVDEKEIGEDEGVRAQKEIE
ncbi:MAG: ribosome recycling factor, partial [Polyangiales bacterium]